MSRLLIMFFFVGIILASCRFNPNLQGKGTSYLQGVWNEDNIGYQNELLQFTSHQFNFSCDSFYVTMTTSSKTNVYPDSCYNNGKWLEYAKGIYSVKNDSIFLTGTFTKSNFKQKISGCYRIGQYIETFVVMKKSDNLIRLKSLKQHLPLELSLKKRTTCIQQPIN